MFASLFTKYYESNCIMCREYRVESWKDLQEILFKDSYNETISRYRSPYAFRGLSDSVYELKTRLMRLGGRYLHLEKHLLRNFRKYGYKATNQGDSLWKWLAIAQHHGLPTRLLDWTYSPYVALHFATANLQKFDVDGAIWCLNYRLTNQFLPDTLKTIIEQEGASSFTTAMLNKVCDSFHSLESLKSGEDFVLFLEPPSIDDRMVNQFALFSMMNTPEAYLEKWLEKRSHLYYKIMIPARLKWEIRDKLDQANITERVLFPGLDGLSAWLTRHYSPKEGPTLTPRNLM